MDKWVYYFWGYNHYHWSYNPTYNWAHLKNCKAPENRKNCQVAPSRKEPKGNPSSNHQILVL